jgi:hypothetical protein
VWPRRGPSLFLHSATPRFHGHVLVEHPNRTKFAEFMTDHILHYAYWHEFPSIINVKDKTYENRKDSRFARSYFFIMPRRAGLFFGAIPLGLHRIGLRPRKRNGRRFRAILASLEGLGRKWGDRALRFFVSLFAVGECPESRRDTRTLPLRFVKLSYGRQRDLGVQRRAGGRPRK